LTFAPIRPTVPAWTFSASWLTSLAGVLAAPLAAEALHHVAGPHRHDACRRQGAVSGSS